MSYRLKAALCGILTVLSSGYSHAALDGVARAVSDGEYQAALNALEAVPETQRDSIEGQLLQAAALAGSGELASAEQHYMALIEKAPALPEAYNNLAVLYARQGKLDEARKLLERAMRTNPSYATVYDNLSSIYLEMSRTAYAKALPIDQRRGGPKLQPIYAVNENRAEPVVVASVEPETVEPVEVEEPAQAEEPLPVIPESAGEAGVSSPVENSESTVQIAESAAETPAPEPTIQAEPQAAAAEESITAERGAQEAGEPEGEPEASVAVDSPAAGTEAEGNQPEQPAPQAVIIAMLKRWAADWAGQNVEDYLGAYDESFTPGHGLSHAQWLAQRRKRLSKPAYIEIELSDFRVNLQGGNRATVDLVQRYRSDRYSDRTRKRFRLLLQPNGWKIVSEKTIEVL